MYLPIPNAILVGGGGAECLPLVKSPSILTARWVATFLLCVSNEMR